MALFKVTTLKQGPNTVLQDRDGVSETCLMCFPPCSGPVRGRSEDAAVSPPHPENQSLLFPLRGSDTHSSLTAASLTPTARRVSWPEAEAGAGSDVGTAGPGHCRPPHPSTRLRPPQRTHAFICDLALGTPPIAWGRLRPQHPEQGTHSNTGARLQYAGTFFCNVVKPTSPQLFLFLEYRTVTDPERTLG